MSTELSNGVIIPEEYSDDWYDEMSINLRKLNDVITAASDNATDIQRLDTDKANQSDLTALTSRVSQNETDIIALQTAVSGALKREIVQTLPIEDISTTTIYMIRNSQSSGTNIYDEYMYINSQWELIGTSATDFSNYYTKNETDNLLSGKVDNSTLGSYYTKTESDNLLSAKANQTDLTALGGRVTQTETDITALQTAVSGALKREIVQSLPTQDISTTTIYMIRNTTTSGDNIYDEYMYINSQWELIGTSATDFSNYYTKTEIDTLLSGKQASLSQTQLDAVNSGIDSSKVQQIATNTSDISSLQSGKANDNSVVHTSGNETVGGVKTITGSSLDFKSTSAEYGVSAGDSSVIFRDKNNLQTFKIYSRVFSSGLDNNLVSFFLTQKVDNTYYISNGIQLFANTGNKNAILRPILANNNADGLSVSLGSSERKWSDVQTYKVNNLEPSSLSLPSDRSARIDISSYITNLGNGDNNVYTVPANGYIWLHFTSINSALCYSQTPGGLTNYAQTFGRYSGDGQLYAFFPVRKNDNFVVQIYTSSTAVVQNAYFIPCNGNI